MREHSGLRRGPRDADAGTARDSVRGTDSGAIGGESSRNRSSDRDLELAIGPGDGGGRDDPSYGRNRSIDSATRDDLRRGRDRGADDGRDGSDSSAAHDGAAVMRGHGDRSGRTRGRDPGGDYGGPPAKRLGS